MLAPDDRLPTIRTLAHANGVSIGAAQGALAGLESRGAVQIEQRGRRGAFLLRRSLGLLWTEAYGEPLIVAMPLPNTQHCNGLATAIRSLLSDAGVPTFCVFVRGSRNRLDALRRRRAHVAVMSALAAEERLPTESIVLELPTQTLVYEHRVYYVDRAGDGSPKCLRVVLDRDSADFQRLTEIEFGNTDVEFIEGTYSQLHRLLREDRADAGVWDVEEGVIALPPPILSRPLSDRALEIIKGRNTRATFVAASADHAVRSVLTAALKPEVLLQIQREVISGERVPEY
jgi:hypothetical protein